MQEIFSLTGRLISSAAAVAVPSYEPHKDAPSTWPDLWSHWDSEVRWGKPLKVFDGASNFTIFDDPEDNYAFRAHHDWAHMMCRADFTPQGEDRSVEFQIAHIYGLFGREYDPVDLNKVARVLRAEVIGQGLYFAHHGIFPDDQKAFVTAYLNSPLAIYRHF